MNDIQIKNILTPLATIIAAWIGTKLNFLGIDQATWNTMVFTTLFAVATGVLGYFGKTTSVLDTTGKLPGTTVVTTPANAKALPDNPDVIAATPKIVEAVKAAS